MEILIIFCLVLQKMFTSIWETFTGLPKMLGMFPTPPGYWEGPYGVLVPDTVNKITSRDGTNRLFKSGSTTEMMYRLPVPTKAEYLEKYTVLGNDGYYYWKQ